MEDDTPTIVAKLRVWLLMSEYQKFLDDFVGRREVAQATSEVSGSLLHQAAKRGHLKAVELLLAAGADVNLCVNIFTSSPLMRAVAADHAPRRVEVIRTLLAHGADPKFDRVLIAAINPRRGDEATCLELVTLLVGAGADVNRVYDIYGDPTNTFTALEWAEEHGMNSVADYLRSKGASDRPDRPPPAPPPTKKRR